MMHKYVHVFNYMHIEAHIDTHAHTDTDTHMCIDTHRIVCGQLVPLEINRLCGQILADH